MRSGTSRYARLIVVTAALAIAAIGLPGSMANASHSGGGGHATADLITDPAAPETVVGTVHFLDADDETTDTTEQGVVVIVDIPAGSGLDPGFHGFHVHANDEGINGCVPAPSTPDQPFTATDGHHNGGTHGDHAGDMPLLHVEDDGSARAAFLTDRFTIADLTSPQRAVIVHANPDNYANIPDRYQTAEGTGPDSATLATGDAGSRVACGEIEAREDQVPQAIAGEALGAVLTDPEGGLVGFSLFGSDGAGFTAGTFTMATGEALAAVSTGFHGHHVHAGNRCQFSAQTYDFGYAQGHLTPAGADHADHAGDLPVLLRPETATVQANEIGAIGVNTTDRLDLDAVRGRTVIIHADPDNYANIPDRYEQTDGEGGVPDAVTLAGGDSGDRAACGMIEGLVRLAGFDRMDTAVAISQDSFLTDDSAPAAVLARADRFPDALAGAPLAEAVGAPMLLTPPGGLDADTAAELQRVLPPGATVYLLGGPVALDPAVEQAVEDLGFQTQRLAGPTRFETAVEIAEQLDSSHERIFLTTGVRWPDAVSAGGAAAHHDAVILFSAGEGPHATTDAYLADHQGEATFAIGGPAARAYPEATAVFGADRNETSVAVAEEFFPDGPTYVGLARDGEFGDDLDDRFADALTGGVHVGRLGGTVLLVHEEQLPDSVRDYLQANPGAIIREYAYGGPIAISQETATAAENSANEGAQASAQGSERFEGMGTSGLPDRLLR